MDVFLGEWLNLLLRWAHMVVGIGWIGTSFYFMALDYTLMKRERMNPGVYGTAWQVHGGGFYHVEKYTVAPPALPDVLHWFKWASSCASPSSTTQTPSAMPSCPRSRCSTTSACGSGRFS